MKITDYYPNRLTTAPFPKYSSMYSCAWPVVALANTKAFSKETLLNKFCATVHTLKVKTVLFTTTSEKEMNQLLDDCPFVVVKIANPGSHPETYGEPYETIMWVIDPNKEI